MDLDVVDMLARVTLAILLIPAFATVHADEADQYLSWPVDLDNAAPVLDRFIAHQVAEVIDRINAQPPESCTCETLTELIFANIYLDRFRPPLLNFIEQSSDVDVYPGREVGNGELLELSIYRDVTLPSVIRVTRNVRVGDVYLGVDKFAHLFGIGRRYYVRYRDMRDDGMSQQDAIDEAIRWGVFTENSILGKTVNGIFSHADLEANYAGLQLAISFCEAETPRLVQTEDGWVLRDPIRIEEHVSPLFDESYNPSHYTGSVAEAVLPVIREQYATPEALDRARARFSRYPSFEPSRSTKIVSDYFQTEGLPSQRDDLLDALGIDDSDPAAPIDAIEMADPTRKRSR